MVVKSGCVAVSKLKEDQAGQAIVEAAIVIPMMVVIILCTIQLTMVQQAKMMMEYAAFNAARAGVVNNADPNVMLNAALVSLVPTFARSDTMEEFFKTWAKVKVITQATNLIDKGTASLAKFLTKYQIKIGKYIPDVAFIKVEVVHPKKDMLGGQQEMDFDDPANADANRLSIRVRYLYIMRIPLANWLIHTSWVAYRVGVTLTGWLHAPEAKMGLGFSNYTLKGKERQKYIDTMVATKAVIGGREDGRQLGIYRLLARTAKIYVMPLEATYTMRMQSNLYKRNLP